MSVSDHNAAYRRGVLLGLTMAEIIILIIFLLLLAFATLLDHEKKNHEAETRLTEKNKTSIERIIRVVDGQDPEITEELVRTIEAMPSIISIIEKNGLAATKDETLEKIVTRAVEKLAVEKQLAETMHGVSAEEKLAQAIQKQKELEADANNLRDQKESLVAQIKREGKGDGWPSCWSDVNKSPEYIFKVDLTNDGIVVHDNVLPSRVEERSRLPLQNVKYDELRSVSQFRMETRSLFDWSQQGKCRFFVLIYDKTGASEKVRFKELLRTVEEHFYKRLVIGAVTEENQPIEKKGDSFFGSLFKSQNNQPRTKGGYN